MSPKVTIIIVNWNGWRDTIECLESLYQLNFPNYRVIVIDNSSQDESVERNRSHILRKSVKGRNWAKKEDTKGHFCLRANERESRKEATR